MKETNNKRRLLRNGEDSFSLIVNNINECKEIINIQIRVNVDQENISEIKPLVKYLIKDKKFINNIRIYFAPVTKQTDACNVNTNKCFTMKEFGKIDSELMEYSNQFYEENKIKYLHYPHAMVMGCSSIGTNTYVIDPDGFLYKCWDEVGCSEMAVGNVFSGIEYNERMINWLTLDLPDKCKKCNVLPLCQSGCPFMRISSNNKSNCHHITTSFKKSLQIYYDMIMKLRQSMENNLEDTIS